MTKLEKLYLNCLRTTADAYRYGTFDRRGAIAFMAGCIESRLRQQAELDGLDVNVPTTPPQLALPQPLSATDLLLQELYAEAITFYIARIGRLRLAN